MHGLNNLGYCTRYGVLYTFKNIFHACYLDFIIKILDTCGMPWMCIILIAEYLKVLHSKKKTDG